MRYNHTKFNNSLAVKTMVMLLRIAMAFIIVFPLWFAVRTSFMDLDEIFMNPPRFLPGSLQLQYYKKALETAPLLRFLLNSLIMSAGITAGQLALGSMAAFAFSFFTFRGKNILFMVLLATMMIPGESIVISNYMTIGDFGWYDSFQGLILPGLASALSLFFLRQAFLKVPRELYDMARIDGCGNFHFFLLVLLPLSRAHLGALGIYTYLGSWNQYLWPLLVTNKTDMRTVQIGIGMLQNAEAMAVNLIMAGITIILLPSILIFFLGQKQILSDAFAGALKG
jgi:sn-glycerol 3-phosphate transport system permease protein